MPTTTDSKAPGGETGKLLRTGATLAANQLVQMLIPLITLVMLGRAGVHALAAGGLVNSVNLLLYLTALGVLQGTVPVLATARGAAAHADAAAAARAAAVLALIAGLVVTAAMAAVPALLQHVGQDARVIGQVAVYVTAVLPALLPAVLIVGMRFVLIALDELVWLNPIALAGALCNLALNLLAFDAPSLTSIAWAMVVANWLMCAAYAAVLLGTARRRPELAGVAQARLRPALRRIVSIGAPVGAILFTETMLFTGSSVLMGQVGARELAAHGVALAWLNLALMVPVGLSQAVMGRLSYLAGQGDVAGARRIMATAGSCAAAYAVLAAGVLLLCPQALARAMLWSRGGGAEVVDVATGFLRLCALTQALAGLVIVGAGALRALRDRASAIWLVAIVYWGVGLGAAALLGLVCGLGGSGIWLGMSAGFAVSCTVILQRYAWLSRQIDRVVGDLAPGAR